MSVGYKLKQTSAEVQAAIDKIIALQPGSLDDIGIYIHDGSYWTEHNDFVPEQGALVAYTDTAKFKMGDGVTAVANLDFLDADLQNAVKFTAQILTAEQKAQARENIDAGTYSKPVGGIPATDMEAGVIPMASDTAPEMDGIANAGRQSTFARADHIHPKDTSKVDKVAGKGLSTEDYTTAEKNKLAELENYDDTALSGRVTAIEEKIPSQASAQNQLADKNFVNSSISTATADFKGTYNSLAELQRVAANANDYGYVVSTDTAGNTVYNRYKYVDGAGWVFEYALNNSSFTSAQWAAINSGITDTELRQILDDISAKYSKPVGGIPASDLAEGVIPDVSDFVTDTEMESALASKQDVIDSSHKLDYSLIAKPLNGIPASDLSLEEEDLANDDGKLQFADRAYNSTTPDGLGYKILRKGVSFASQVTEANTIYEIRYDFALSANFTIPSGCTLRFNGGSISGAYTLTGADTIIEAEAVKIFSSVTIAGTWNTRKIYSVWFAKDKYTIANVMALNNADITTDIFIDGDYDVYVAATGMDGIDIASNTIVHINGTLTKDATSASYSSSLFTIEGSNISVLGGVLDGNKGAFSSSGAYGQAFYISSSRCIKIDSVTVADCHGDGIYIGGSNDNTGISITNCEIYGCRRNGISMIYAQDVLIAETYFHDINDQLPGAALDVEPNTSTQLNKNLVMRNCIIENCRDGICLSGTNAPIENSLFENCVISMTDYYNLLTFDKARDTTFVGCSISSIGERGTSYAIIGATDAGNVMFKNCTFYEENGLSTGGYLAFYASFERCIFNITSRIAETWSGRFRDCDITSTKGCSYGSTNGLYLENCKLTTSGSLTLSGRSAAAPAKKLFFKNCELNLTAKYYPILANLVEDVEIVGCKITAAGSRNLINFTSAKNVRVNHNEVIVGSNNVAIAFDSNSSLCQANGNNIYAADGVTWTNSKYSGINNKTALTNRPGEPFYWESGGKMLMFNGTAVVNLDGSAVS